MRRGWMAIVMCALFVGTLIGVVWARPDRSAHAADHLRKLTVPAAFFHPTSGGQDYNNDGYGLWLNSGGASFTAPVVFPCLPSVTVERIILSVEDQSAGGNACVTLYRTKPNQGTEKEMGYACSPAAGSQPGVIEYTDDSIDYAVVWPSQGPYLWLNISNTNVVVYGVQIEYRRNI